ncbi:MAG: hypothetical protein IT381_17660 [Deltaproteobacteria bacterium]|nr:hypothetical protein [Deltaproteobacteria bacterium]
MRLPIGPLAATALILVPILTAAGSFLRAGAVKMLVLEAGFVVLCAALGLVYALKLDK